MSEHSDPAGGIAEEVLCWVTCLQGLDSHGNRLTVLTFGLSVYSHKLRKVDGLEVSSVKLFHRNKHKHTCTHTYRVCIVLSWIGLVVPPVTMAREKRQPVADNFAWGCEWITSAISFRLKLHLSKGIGSILWCAHSINSNLLHKRKKKGILCCQVIVVEIVILDMIIGGGLLLLFVLRLVPCDCLSKFQIYKAQFFKDCIPWDEDNKGKNDLVMKSLTFSKITRKIFRVFPHHTKIPNWGKMSSGEHLLWEVLSMYLKKKQQQHVFNFLLKGWLKIT